MQAGRNLSIHIRQDKINAAQNRQQVRDHQSTADHGNHLDMREGWRADAGAVRFCSAVADQVVAVVAFGRLDLDERLAGRDDRSPAHVQKMVDQGLDVVHRVFFERGRCQRVVGFVRASRHIVHALLDDAQALAHLLDTHHGPVVAIAVLAVGMSNSNWS